MTMSISKSNSE